MKSNPQFRVTATHSGLWLIAGPDMLAMTDRAGDFTAVAAQWDDLPTDPYLTDATPFRFRRHAQVVFDAATDELIILPPTDYLQAAANNSLFGGVPRRFAPVEHVPAARGSEPGQP